MVRSSPFLESFDVPEGKKDKKSNDSLRGLFLALSMHGYNRMIVASNLGKVASIVFPVMFISLLQLDAVKRSWMGFFVLADLPRERELPPLYTELPPPPSPRLITLLTQ